MEAREPGKRRKEKANVRSRIRLANKKNYIAIEQKKLKKYKLMLIGNIDKHVLLDLWYFLKASNILIIWWRELS